MATKIPAAGQLVGKKLSDLTLPYGTSVVLIVSSNGRIKTLDSNVIIEEEDEMVAISPVNSTKELYDLFTELR